MLELDGLREQMDTVVRLHFNDGQVVLARLFNLDTEEHDDLMYDLLEIIHHGGGSSSETKPGESYRAFISELAAWEPSETGHDLGAA